MRIKKSYFYGNKVSDYGIERGYVDYRTFSQAFEHILNNVLISNEYFADSWDIVSSGINQDQIDDIQDQINSLYDQIDDLTERPDSPKDLIDKLYDQIDDLQDQIDELERVPEIFQYYIVPDYAIEILELNHEIIYYNDKLDIYLWGVTHWGTAWDYVLTDIKIDR